MFHLIHQHPVYAAVGGYFILSNAVGALDAPDEKSGKFYRFFYRFAHGVAFNLKYAFRAKFPELVSPQDDPNQK